ncbi:MAG: transposase [Desulfobacterales bacterium]|nr:transposase [Desulfobacterales bacterium]
MELKSHLAWIPKYRKRVSTRQGAIRARDILREMVLEKALEIIRGEASSGHVHRLIYHVRHRK